MLLPADPVAGLRSLLTNVQLIPGAPKNVVGEVDIAYDENTAYATGLLGVSGNMV